MRSSKTEENPFETNREDVPTRNGIGSASHLVEPLKDIQSHVMSVVQLIGI